MTGAGGHLGWFDGPFFGSASKDRWISKPAIEWLGAASRDFGAVGKVVVRRDEGEEEAAGHDDGAQAKAEGWTWVEQSGHAIQGGCRRGWKVLDEKEVVHGEEGGGTLQGL